jgi:hypothetical protein
VFLKPGDDGRELLFGEFGGKGIGPELSLAEGSGDELADEVHGIASTQVFFRPGGFDWSHRSAVQQFISYFELGFIRSGSGRYPVDPVRMRSIDGRSQGVLIGSEAVCFHNWLIWLAAACGHDAAWFCFLGRIQL